MPFDKQQFLSSLSVRRESVRLPGIAEPILVYEMTGLEHDRFDADTYKVDASGKPAFRREHYRARLFVACVKDEQGRPLFGLDDLEAVSALGTSVLDKVGDVARRRNALTDADVVAEAKN